MTAKRQAIKRAVLCTGVAALLVSASAGVRAHVHLGSDLPPLGGVKTAGALVKAGDAAAALGCEREAISDYRAALAACLFYEDAQIGLARCWAAVGDYAASINYYHHVIYDHQETGDIDLTTEYILVLSQAGGGAEAVSLYNGLVTLCAKGTTIRRMEAVPHTFLSDGSDYDPAELQAMTHLMRAMNSDSESDARAASEVQKAAILAPSSAIVSYYEGVVLSRTDSNAAAKAFARALTLSHSTAKVAKGDERAAALLALKKQRNPV